MLMELTEYDYLKTTKEDYIENIQKKLHIGEKVYFEHIIQGLILILKNTKSKDKKIEEFINSYIDMTETALLKYDDILWLKDVIKGLSLILLNMDDIAQENQNAITNIEQSSTKNGNDFHTIHNVESDIPHHDLNDNIIEFDKIVEYMKNKAS